MTVCARGITAAALLFAGLASAQSTPRNSGWTAYNGGINGDHYSPLAQINRGNVAQLHEVWRYDTGDKGQLQTNPLIVGATLYAYTPTGKVFALDAATGKRLWQFDSGEKDSQPTRGLSWWTDGAHSRLFAGVMNYLYALDPATGRPIPGFGENGRIDLRKNLRGDYKENSIALTSPGIVYKDLIIVGGRNPETHPAPPGDIRAYDVRTGALRWSFHTIPHPGEYGYDTWPPDAWKTAGAANNWAGMTLDAAHGILYAPTGSAVFDFYGGDRIGNDLFANTLLALDANTGRRLWHFQGVHHDIWDRDFPSPPALLTVTHDGHPVEAIAQTTKQGVVYLFNRLTGAPLFPIAEHPFPPSDVPGEKTAATQPWPSEPAPFARQRLTANDLTNRTPEAHAWALKTFATLRSDGQFLPMTVGQLTVVFPGFDGGAEWGGPAVDPNTGILYVNANEMAWLGGLVPTAPQQSPGAAVYQSQCSVCHGPNRAGSPPAFPSLEGITDRLTNQQITDVITHGRGRMPALPISGDQLSALLAFLKTTPPPTSESPSPARPKTDTKANPHLMPGGSGYSFTGYNKFLDPDGYPAISTPWGTLTAIDLNTGRTLWHIPFGEYPALAAEGMKDTGSENYGGPVVTAGGLLFIGATVYDRKFHAFDASTGKLLWETELPFAGCATPATYSIHGKQYVVIAAGGGRDPKSPTGGSYVAFALP